MGLSLSSSKNTDKKKDNAKVSGKKKGKKNPLKIPKTAQQSIPYEAVYEESGIIEIADGVFTKAYRLKDINYQIAKLQEQEEMFIRFGEFINSFDFNVRFQVVVLNKNMDQSEFERQTLLKPHYDILDPLREEYNEMLLDKIREGRNNMTKEKFLVVSVTDKSYEAARDRFIHLDAEIAANIKKIGGSDATPLTTMERLESLHDIYNVGNEGVFGGKVVKYGRDIKHFTFENMRRMGLTTKDCIAPPCLEFKNDYMMIGEKYARALYLKDIPSYLSDTILSDLTSLNSSMLTSIQYTSVPQDKALKIVRAQIVNINAALMDRQKKASRNGYDVSLISPELQKAQQEANELLQDLTSKNQKMFLINLVIVHFADSLEALNLDTDSIQNTARRSMCEMKKLLGQQEFGFATALPLCHNKLAIERTLTTESVSVFMPFVSQELLQKNGMYYGLNSVSRNLLLFNRKMSKNMNGFILGTPGSGKSFTAKREMLNVLLNTNDDVIVIDPEAEYGRMAELLRGDERDPSSAVIRIAAGSKIYINPMDMDEHYADEDDPITLKSDFLISLCETAIGDRYGLTAAQRSIIDRCCRQIYQPYLNSRDVTGKYDKTMIPTLLDFQHKLEEQPGYEAEMLASSLEIYTKGSLNLFAHHTNVDTDARFVVYDIKDIGNNIKSLAMLVVLDSVWNRIIENKKKGRNTWFYIDEIYLLFKTDTSANFLRECWKRARKWGGVPTGITQNVSDLLQSDTARTMLSNCDFVCMLNQAPLDRNALAELLNISSTQLSYITNSSPGEGLIYTGSSILPFVDQFPKNTKMYQAMTSKMEEVVDLEKKLSS